MQGVRRGRLGQRDVHDARFDARHAAHGVDVDDALEALQAEEYGAVGERAAA